MGRDMTGPNTRVETAELEAAAWHARLGEPRVSTQTIEDFFAWRSKPENADAYRRVEAAWTGSGRLAASPQIQAALDAALSSGPERKRSRSLPPALLALAAGLVIVALFYGSWVWLGARSGFETGVGEQRLVQLADGSSVQLDTDTRLRVRFSDGQRLVDLERGQALFTVAHDASRPFIVQADGTSVTAVGTVFDVRRDALGVRVTLVSGAVDVAREGQGAPARLAAGQQSNVTNKGVATRAVDVAAAVSWTEGRIVFVDTPLNQAVAEVNRYLTMPVALAPGADGVVAVNGVFKAGDRDAFVSAASGALGLRATTRDDGSVLLSGAAGG
jgi:transmembrane sensor